MTPDTERVTVTKVGNVWRVAWRVPPFNAHASWEFASEDKARKAAAIIAAWHS